MTYIWDERYSDKEYVFGKRPNLFFESALQALKPGRLLVPGAGEGRDAVYAATLGWKVDCFDLSATGRDKCMKLAAEFKTSVQYDILNAAEFKGEPEKYDAVAMIFFHLPETLRRAFHREIVKCLKRGGTVILEAFNPAQLQNPVGGPKDIAMLMTPAMLEADFAGLNILMNKEMDIVLHEGKYHEGKAAVVRFKGMKE